MSILFCDFMDEEWIKIFQKVFKNKKKIFIDDYRFKKLLKKNKINYYKFLEKRNCRRNLYFKNKNYQKKIKNYSKEFIFKRYFDIGKFMIMRFDPNRCLSDKKFKEIFNKSVHFWLNFLKKNKVLLFFCKTSPHQFYDYIIYACCKKLKIKTNFFGYTYFKDHIFLLDDIDRRDKLITKHFINKNTITTSNRIDSIIKEKSKKFYARPEYIKKEKYNSIKIFIYILKNFIKLIYIIVLNKFNEKSDIELFTKENQFFDKNYKFTELDMTMYQIKSLYKKIFLHLIYYKFSKSFFVPDKFIFFAAQFQPEATSCPEGGIYNDNIKILKELRACLPSSVKIVYKEHPASFNPNPNLFGDIRRSYEYYKELSKIKNLSFSKLNYDSFELIDKSIFCVTVAGQIGLECSIRAKPCVILNKLWYKNFPNIYFLNKISDIKNFYEQIIDKKKVIKNNFKQITKIKNGLNFFFKKTLNTNLCNEYSNKNNKNINKIIYYLNKNI